MHLHATIDMVGSGHHKGKGNGRHSTVRGRGDQSSLKLTFGSFERATWGYS